MSDCKNDINTILNNIVFPAPFDGIRFGDVLHIQICSAEQGETPSFLKSFLRILKRTLVDYYEFAMSGNGDTLFLFSEAYSYRKDHLPEFQNVTELVDNKLIMKGEKKRLSLHRAGKLNHINMLNECLKPVFPGKKLRWFLIQNIYTAYSARLEFEQAEEHFGTCCRTLVSFCDIHSVDAYFTQFFNLHGKQTVTLQHGTYISGGMFGNWAFLGSESDVFLANSDFARDEAREAGYEVAKMKVVGQLSQIGKQNKQKARQYQNRVIGLALDGLIYSRDNFEILEMVQSFCEETGRELKIKLHPTDDKKRYTPYLNNAVVSGVFSNEIGIKEFIDMVDVGIVHNSTVFLDFLSEKPVLLVETNGLNTYQRIPFLKVHNSEELHEGIEKINEDCFQKEMTEARAYCCPGENIKDNYVEAFREMGIC